MYKRKLTGNELATIELLGLDPDFAVVARDKNGKYFVIDLTEDEDEEYPYRVTMHKPVYHFDGKKESVPKQLVGAVEFDIQETQDGIRTIIVSSERVLPDAFTRDCIYKYIEGYAYNLNQEYKKIANEPVIDLILIKGTNTDGKKNGFVPYSNLGYESAFHYNQSCAVKREDAFQERKFNNSFSELYDQFEKIIPTNMSERE